MDKKFDIIYSEWSSTIRYNHTSYCSLQLEDANINDVTFEISRKVDKHLNAAIVDNALAITPKEPAKRKNYIVVFAKQNNKVIAKQFIPITIAEDKRVALGWAIGLGIGIPVAVGATAGAVIAVAKLNKTPEEPVTIEGVPTEITPAGAGGYAITVKNAAGETIKVTNVTAECNPTGIINVSYDAVENKVKFEPIEGKSGTVNVTLHITGEDGFHGVQTTQIKVEESANVKIDFTWSADLIVGRTVESNLLETPIYKDDIDVTDKVSAIEVNTTKTSASLNASMSNLTLSLTPEQEGEQYLWIIITIDGMKYDAKLPINVSPDTFDTTNYYILTTDSTPIYFGAGEKLTQDEVTALANTSSTGSGTITINGKTVDPKTIKEIHIGSTDGTVTIPRYFLYGCSNMKTMFLRGLRTTSFENTPFVMMENDGTHAADNYQYWVPNLETISVPTIIKTGDTCKIPACFLDWSFENAGAIGHSNFTNVDLTGLEQATEIGSHFVKNTNLMKKIDLNPLRNVTKVGSYFLGYNHSLTTLYLSAMKKLETIEGAFLEKSTKIKSIDLTALSKMKTIPGQFMLGCDGLEIADFSNFVNLGSESSEGIQGRFMAYCSGLKVLYLPNKDPNTYTIVSGELLQNVPTSCVIHCGDYLQQYKSHDVWKKWSGQMVK